MSARRRRSQGMTLPTLDAVMRGISRRMREDGLLPDRRRGVGMWAWRAAEGLALGVLGLAYLVALIAIVALIGDWMGAL